MALIKCNECGRTISDQARSCPGCGAITYTGRKNEEQKVQDQIKAISMTVLVIILVIILIVGIVLLLLGIKDMYSDVISGWYTYTAPFTKHEQDVIGKIIGGIGLIVFYLIGILEVRKAIGYDEKNSKAELKSKKSSRKSSKRHSSAMWLCPDCNAKNKEQSYICGNCGYKRI